MAARLFTGAATAAVIYFFLKSTVQPQLDSFDQQITQLAANTSTIGLIADAATFLNLSWIVMVLLSASGAAFSLKLMLVAMRAFGIKS